MVQQPDFKSLDERVQNTSDIQSIIGNVLSCQDGFDRITSECPGWSEEQISTFKIVSDQITRVFYIKSEDVNDEFPYRKFVMVVRVKYEDRDVYVELVGFNALSLDSDTSPRGVLYISESASLFMEVLPDYIYMLASIHQLLAEDGIRLEEMNSVEVMSERRVKWGIWDHYDLWPYDYDDDDLWSAGADSLFDCDDFLPDDDCDDDSFSSADEYLDTICL